MGFASILLREDAYYAVYAGRLLQKKITHAADISARNLAEPPELCDRGASPIQRVMDIVSHIFWGCGQA